MDPAEVWPAPDVRERWERLMALLDPRPGERVLDVGCGRGQPLRFVADRVGPSGRAIGIEPSAGVLASLARRGPEGAAGAVADGADLPFAAETFDAVLCVNMLEAAPDRPRVLAEIRRVLKSGGRIVLAHDDIESQVYTGTDRELSRRAVRAYADATFGSYATSDGQLGRHLWGLFRAASFRDPELRVFPLVNTEYREGLMGWTLAQFPAQLVAPVSNLTDEELDHWRADLAACSARGEYVYCLNLYVCSGRK